MKREVYERQKAFAGEKKPSMLRRCVDHDYTERMMYMVTMVTEDRRPLFGTVVGRSGAERGSNDEPRLELSALGRRVADEWWGIPRYYPQIEIKALQMMPDHMHGIIFFREKMEKDLSRVIRGFKTGCNRAYRELFPAVQSVVTQSQQTGQQTGQPPSAQKDRYHGLLFAPGFNDKLLLRQGQLQRWLEYLKDNPRRLLMKREHPDLFRMHRDTVLYGLPFTSLGNHFLLDVPDRQLVEMSRTADSATIEGCLKEVMAAAHRGAVTYTAAISDGEKLIARKVREQGFPLVVLLADGFPEEGSPYERFYKPGGVYFEACSQGRLLLLEPKERAYEHPTVVSMAEEALRRKAEAKHYVYTAVPHQSKRYRFVALNEMGRIMVGKHL